MVAISERRSFLSQLWGEIQQVRPDARILITVDGFHGAGKTHLAEEPAACAPADGRAAVWVSIDGFHRSWSERRAAGNGPEGFYRGSHRHGVFRQCVVDPLRDGRPITPAIGHHPDPEAPSSRRCVQGQRLYLAEADPGSQASWVLDNSALSRPQLSTPAGPADRRRRREGRGEASGGNDDLGPEGLP